MVEVLSARMAGVRPVGGIDLWPIATAAYKANFSAETWCSRIEEIDPAEVVKSVGSIDLLLASPECTNHSVAKGNAPRCEKSRRTAFEVVRFAKKLKPRWLVVENVTSMRKWSAFDEWWQELESIGYHLKAAPLRSELFGVPQSRRRLFVVGDLEADPALPIEPVSRRTVTIGKVIDRLRKRGHNWHAGHLDSRKRLTHAS